MIAYAPCGTRILSPAAGLVCSCDVERAQASVCALSKLNFRCLLPMHDATGKGLSAADVATFAGHLPACAAAGKGG